MSNWKTTDLASVSVLDDGSRVSADSDYEYDDGDIIRAARAALGYYVRFPSGSEWSETSEHDDYPEVVRSLERGIRAELIEEGEAYSTGEYESLDAALAEARSNIDAANYDVTRSIRISAHARDVDTGEESVTASETLHPDEPECSDDDGHDWCSDHDLVGGIKENPGVWGSGHGSVSITEACRHCGCRRVTDHGATCSEDGTQMTRVDYDEGYYADQIEQESREYTYSIYDGDPSASSVDALDGCDEETLEADSDEEAMDAVRDALDSAAVGLDPSDGYVVGDVLYARVTGPDGTEAGRLTRVVTADDLGIAEMDCLSAARAALETDGYSVSRSSTETTLYVSVPSGDDDDSDLEAIRDLVRPLGCTAEWTGNGNTDSDGHTTSDIAIERA